jgi:chromosome segregation ATPase
MDKIDRVLDELKGIKKWQELISEEQKQIREEQKQMREEQKQMREEVRQIREQQEENTLILRALESAKDEQKAELENIKHKLVEIQGDLRRHEKEIEWNKIDIAVLKKAIGSRE